MDRDAYRKMYREMHRDLYENVPQKVIDITGIELTPGKPEVCLGSGDLDFDCCCDECDYFLLCFPDYDPKISDIFED